MKSFRIFVFAMLFMPLAAMATTNFVWTRGLSALGGVGGKCVGADAAGNVIVAGNFSGSMAIGATNLLSVTGPSGSQDIFMAKYNPDGNVVWVRQAGGTNTDNVNAMTVDRLGNIYVSGYFTSRSTVIGGITITNQGLTNLFIAKFDTNGQVLWAKTGLGNSSTRGAGIGLAVTSDGNVYLTGAFFGTMAFDGISVTGATTSVLLAKFDSSGAALWVRNGGTAQGNAVATDPEGNAVVTGSFLGNVIIGGTSFTSVGQDVFVMKYDAQGNVEWVRQGGGPLNDFGVAVGADQSGSIYVSGTFIQSANFGEHGLTAYYMQAPGGGPGPLALDIFVTKYDSDGRVLWAQKYGSYYADTGGAICVDAAGNSHVTGGANGVFIAGFDSNGVGMGTNTASTNLSNLGQGIVADGFGNVYATGSLTPNTNHLFGSDVLTNSTFFLTKVSVFGPSNPPVFTSDLASQTIMVTSNHLFSVGVTSISPLSYQWQFNGADIPQATNSLLELTNVTFERAGLYNVVVSNALGATTSSVAKVEVDFPQEFLWARQAGGVRLDEARCIKVYTNGIAYVAGRFQFKAVFGSINLTNYDVSPSLTFDIFLAKYDPAGNLLWVQQAGGVGQDEIFDLAIDGDENVYISGYYSGTAKFGGIILNNSSGGSASGYVAKYDPNGNVVWAQQIPAGPSTFPTKLVQPFALAVDKTNGVYLTGRLAGSATFGPYTVASPGLQCFFLAKADGNGHFQWVQTGGSTNTTTSGGICDGLDLAIDGSNNIVVAGFFSETAYFGTNVLKQFGKHSSFIAKYSPAGDLLGAKNILSTDSCAFGVAIDEASNVFVTGRYGSSVQFGGGALPDLGVTNLFVVKYDALENPLWGQGIGGTNDAAYCVGNSLATDARGNVYVAGTNSGATRFNRDIVIKPGGFVAKFGAGGNFLWAKPAGKEANSVAGNGTNVYVTGSFVNAENFGITNLLTGSSNDVFVAKLGINGPNITVPLTNYFVVQGSNTTLRVTTTGTGPLSYQWLYNNAPIAGATGSTLTLTNLHLANEGVYGVLVSNPLGTAKNLGIVLVIPMMNAPRVDGTNLVISWEDAFDLQVSTNGVVGPYHDVPGATSPLTNSLEAGSLFYRLVR